MGTNLLKKSGCDKEETDKDYLCCQIIQSSKQKNWEELLP
jgi:hypothetical protein